MASMTRAIVMACLVIAGCAGQPAATECTTGITCPDGTKCAAVQAICITNDCGDGIVQTTEICDDGNILDGDGCAANCLSREQCGDGVLNSAAGELCDDHNTTGGDGCAADCRSVEVCGNGVRDVSEVCDDGNTVPGDGCNGTCTSTEICGNGIKDVGELCDDANMPGGCNNNCQGGTGCGDGVIDQDGNGDPIEECDDGNNDDQDDCRKVFIGSDPNPVCKLAQCGDGFEQTSGSRIEECDPGAAGETADCNSDCTDNTCGDGVVNHTANEQCDDGAMNSDNRDCTSTCQYNICGDMKPNTMGTTGEQCDDGNNQQMDACSNSCTVPTCGNNIIEMGEACDDGNTNNNDGCAGTNHPMLAACQFESCGDGVINNGEMCDPGPAFETADCNSDCTESVCGDQKVNRADGEECEEMNTTDNDRCRPPNHPTMALRCKLNVCGDGNTNALDEACDDGNAINTDTCTNACQSPTCGDGIKQAGEACDDGNNGVQTDNCRDGCILPTCGDGIEWAGVEECDLGMGNSDTGNCTVACKDARCGDGFIDGQVSQTETCDDGNNVTETVADCPYGTASCTFCNAGCNGTTTFSGNVCGDGVVGGPEMCDDGNTIEETVCPYGQASCMSFCAEDCSGTLTLNGPTCGDGTMQATYEACDDGTPTQSCGLCSDACGFAKVATAATAILLMPAGGTGADPDLVDTDHFTLNDGFTSVTFEFDVANDGATAMSGRRPIRAENADSASVVRDRAVISINGSALQVQATPFGANGVLITNQLASAVGNTLITNMVSTDDFYAPPGLTGGWGRDCANALACSSDNDCRSGRCSGTSNTCVACTQNNQCASNNCDNNGVCQP
jgi:cysteine-rich repeat protein